MRHIYQVITKNPSYRCFIVTNKPFVEHVETSFGLTVARTDKSFILAVAEFLDKEELVSVDWSGGTSIRVDHYSCRFTPPSKAKGKALDYIDWDEKSFMPPVDRATWEQWWYELRNPAKAKVAVIQAEGDDAVKAALAALPTLC